MPMVKRGPEDTSLAVYDNNHNLIIEILEQPEPEREAPRLYGYARVSTRKQNPELQEEPLKALGCDEIVTEKISAFSRERPLFNALLCRMKKGDTLAVWKLDRLGRENVRFIQDNVLFGKRRGKFHLPDREHRHQDHIRACHVRLFLYYGRYETEIKRERTEAGRELARVNGKSAGRPKGITPATRKKTKAMREMYEAKNANGTFIFSANEIAKTLGISKKTLYKGLKAAGVEIGHRTSVF